MVLLGEDYLADGQELPNGYVPVKPVSAAEFAGIEALGFELKRQVRVMNECIPSYLTQKKCSRIVTGMEKILEVYCGQRKVIARQPVLVWNGRRVQDEQNVSFVQHIPLLDKPAEESPQGEQDGEVRLSEGERAKVLASATNKANSPAKEVQPCAKKAKVVKAAVMSSRGEKVYKRSQNCKECTTCQRDNCGKCRCCLDMPMFHGPGKWKQKCLERKCLLRKE